MTRLAVPCALTWLVWLHPFVRRMMLNTQTPGKDLYTPYRNLGVVWKLLFLIGTAVAVRRVISVHGTLNILKTKIATDMCLALCSLL